MPLLTTSVFSASDTFAVPAVWSLCRDDHVIRAMIVARDPDVEAQILLDGHVLYRSRHATMALAAEELVVLKGHWGHKGWIEAS